MQVKKVDKINRMLGAATELFSESTFHDVKLDQVAKKAGVGKGTIYTYFKSKDDLLIKCLTHDMPMVLDEMVVAVTSPNLSFIESLKKLIEIHFSFSVRKSSLIQQVIELGPNMKITEAEHKHLKNMFMASVEVVRDFLAKAMERGDISAEFSPTQAAIFLQRFFSVNTAFAMHGEPRIGPDKFFDLFMKLFGTKRS